MHLAGDHFQTTQHASNQPTLSMQYNAKTRNDPRFDPVNILMINSTQKDGGQAHTIYCKQEPSGFDSGERVLLLQEAATLFTRAVVDKGFLSANK